MGKAIRQTKKTEFATDRLQGTMHERNFVVGCALMHYFKTVIRRCSVCEH